MIHLPNDDNCCGWYASLTPATAQKKLTQDEKADFVVVGAGFAGLAIARRLAQHAPTARILLIDAQQVGQGASGRNSGFVIDLPHKFALEHPNPEHKQKILRLNRYAISQLAALIEEHNIDCQWSATGKYQGAVSERGLEKLDHFARLMRELGEPWHNVEGKALSEILGTSYYQRAIYTPGSYLMQPAALVRGLADSLPDNVERFENSPIRSLTREGKRWRLRGDHGTVSTPTLLLGTSIFTREFGWLKNRLLPVMTFASWTRPLNEAERDSYGGQLNWGLTPADHAGTTLRMTMDGRIMVRNTYKYVPRYGHSVSDHLRQKIQQEHRQAFLARYPGLEAVHLSHTWGGTYAISRNFTNFFGKLDDGVYACACDNGVGAAWGTVSGSLLADLAAGIDSSLLADIQTVTGMPAINPPEPLLGLGVRSKIRFAKWQSRSEL